MSEQLHQALKKLQHRYGADLLKLEFDRLTQDTASTSVCTILINDGLHYFPKTLFVGECFVFYSGGLDLSSEQALEKEMAVSLVKLQNFLRKRKWERIYTIISGHAAACMQVKLAVYRITHIETIDWVFDGAGNYLKLELPLRQILTDASRNKNEDVML